MRRASYCLLRRLRKAALYKTAAVVRKLVCAHFLDLIRGDNVENIEVNISGAEEEVALDLLAAAYRGDDQRDAGLLRDLEGAGMEGQQRRGLAARTFGVDADGADVLFQIIRGGEDGLEGVAVILTVDGQEARAVGHAPDDGDAHIGGLGDKGNVIIPELAHNDERVEHRAVVADKQETLAGGQLIHAVDVCAHPGVAAHDRADGNAAETADTALLCDGLRGLDKDRDDCPEQQEQNVQRDEAAREQQQSLPHHKARKVYIYNYRRERQQEKQKDQS